ncbi:MAG: hypothetical protein IID46_16130 [Planctomycetes bacterium]|nr:hypothetical protein [Planctomycetota bacterium]
MEDFRFCRLMVSRSTQETAFLFGTTPPACRIPRRIRRIFRELGKTTVIVTHDLGEAAYFGDEIVLLRAGAIVQQGTIGDLVERPQDPFVTQFIQAQRSPLETIAGESA